MSYAIEKGEGLAAALGRIASEEMDRALKELRRNGGESVHNTRKALKRLRALLRSLRVTFPEELFQSETARMAAAGRKISPLRDAHVQLQMLRKLDASANPAGRKVREILLEEQTHLARKMPQLRRTVRGMLNISRHQMSSWPLQGATPRGLAAGLKRIYKKGRKAAKTAGHNPSPENLHEWRKKAKALGYGFELMENLCPKKVSRLVDCLTILTEALGDDHDLFLVLQALRREQETVPGSDFLELSDKITARRAKLQKRAFKEAKKLYAEKPGEFEKSIARLLQRARRK